MESWARSGHNKWAWKTTKYMTAKDRIKFKKVSNQQLKRKNEEQKAEERNICRDINGRHG